MIYLHWFVTTNQESFAGCLQQMRDDGIGFIFVQGLTWSEHSNVVQREDNVLLLEHFEFLKKEDE